MNRTRDRHPQRRRDRKSAYQLLAETCRPVVESLESRQLLTGYSVERVSVATDGTEATAASGTSSVSHDGNWVAFTSTAALTPEVDENNTLSLVYLRNRSTGVTTLVSKTAGGAVPNNKASEPAISANGKFVAYSSPATNLVSGDSNGQADIFLYDVEHDVTTLLSVGVGGAGADSTSSSPTVSQDGRYVAFVSNASNLVAGDTNNASDVFVVDTTTGVVTRVSTNDGGTQGNAPSYGPVISADGKSVAFLSDATNLIAGGDTNGVADVYLKDLTAGSTRRVSVSSAGNQADSASGRIAINADGTFIAFESAATNLVTGDGNNSTKDPAKTDIFLRDLVHNTTIRITEAFGGGDPNGVSTKPTISADGRFVAYTSTASNLLPAGTDTNGKADVFLYDNTAHTTRRVSTGPNESQTTDESDDAAISGNGRYIAFRSNDQNLLTNNTDQNGVGDVFIKDRLAVPLAAVRGTPDGNNPQTIPAGDTSPATADGTDFGVVDLADAAVDHTFTITNTGSDRLIFNGSPLIRISGPNAGDFVVTVQPTYPNGASALDPGDTVTFTVRFKPLGVGIRTATVTFTSNDGSKPTYTFTLSGAAIDATVTSRMVVTQGSTAVATGVGGAAYGFGTVARGSGAVTRTFTVTNVSGQAIAIDPASLASGASGFEIDTPFDIESPQQPVTIAPGRSATFVLRMLSTTAGTASATINLSNTVVGTTDTQATTFAVSGTVVIPAVTVLLNGQALAKGQTVNFGAVVKGGAAASRTFTLRNDGQAVLTLGAMTLPAGYTLLTTLPASLQPGASITFTVQLDSSTAVGAKTGTLSLVNGDPVSNPYTLTLTGSITTPALSVTTGGATVTSNGTANNLGTGVQGQTVPTKTFTIKNTGTANLTVTLGAMPSGFTLVTAPAGTLEPGATTTIVIGLSTASVGSPTGGLVLTTNDPTNATFRLNLAGTVVANTPKAVILVDGTAVGGTAISFGTVSQGTTRVTKVITIRNDGTRALALGAITLPAGFEVVSGLASTSVGVGESTTFTIGFTPILAGNQTGVLSVGTNETGRSAVSAGVTASVTAATKSALTVESVAPTRLPSVVLGGTKTATATATVTLGNYSSATLTGSYKITVYAATGAFARPGTDKVLGTLAVQVNLKSKAKTAYAVKLAFPTPPADGAYNIVAVVTGPKADPAYNFNRAPFTVRIEKAQAKIGVAGSSPLTTGSFGKKATQTITLSNTGNQALAGTMTGDLYLTKDGTLNGAAKIATLAGLKINNLAPRGTQKVTLSFTLPKSAPSGFSAKGTYTLLFKITKVVSATPSTLNNGGLVLAGKINLK